MITFDTRQAAQSLADRLSIEDTLSQRDPEGPTTYMVSQAPIVDDSGMVTGYHQTQFAVSAYGPLGNHMREI